MTLPCLHTNRPPPDRRRFANRWDEAIYVYNKASFWLLVRQDPRRVAAFVDRLCGLLDDLGEEARGALLGMQARALIARHAGDHSAELAEMRRAVDGRLQHLVGLEGDANTRNEAHAWAILELANRYTELGHPTRGRQQRERFESFCQAHGLSRAQLSRAARRGAVAIYANPIWGSAE